MDFLDINLTRDSSLLLHAIHSPFFWWILKKTIVFSGFKYPCKKSPKQENSSLSMNSIVQNRKIRVENKTKSGVSEDSSLCRETITENAVQEFHLRFETPQLTNRGKAKYLIKPPKNVRPLKKRNPS